MKKEIICEKCKGIGKIEIKICDECGSDLGNSGIGLDLNDKKHKCYFCWMSELSKAENLLRKEREELLKGIKRGTICLNCGDKKEGRLTDWCDKCLENN